MRMTRLRLFVFLCFLFTAPLLLAEPTFATDIPPSEVIELSKVAELKNCGGNFQGFTMTRDYYIAACSHEGEVAFFRWSGGRSVSTNSTESGKNDLEYYSLNNQIIVGGKYFYDINDNGLGFMYRAKASGKSIGFNYSYAGYDSVNDVFIVGGNGQFRVCGDILNDKTPECYTKIFEDNTHSNQGSTYHNGILYRVAYCLKSNDGSFCHPEKRADLDKGQSAITAYNVITGEAVGYYTSSDYGEMQDLVIYNGTGYLLSSFGEDGPGYIYEITGPESLLGYFNQETPIFDKNPSDDNTKDPADETDDSETSDDSTKSDDSSASAPDANKPKTAILKTNSIMGLLDLIVEIMRIGIPILGALGIVLFGIQYLTAGGDEAKAHKAKRRMLEVVIGLVAYAVAAALFSWLGV